MISIIAMLTHNDVTVDDALGYYKQNKDAIVNSWGFKDKNISTEDAKELALSMLADGKKLFFESLVKTEAEALDSAKVAVECNVDYIVGMEYFNKVHEYLKSAHIKYFPTCGRRAGYPLRMLYGEINEIIEDAHRILEKGVDGICLSVFRYADGNPLELAKKFVSEVNAPLVVTGGINSDERLDFIKDAQPWGFTVGSALFEKNNFPGISILEKLNYIYEYLN